VIIAILLPNSSVLAQIEIAPAAGRWRIRGAPTDGWRRLGYPAAGEIVRRATEPLTVTLVGARPVLSLSGMPASEALAFAGSGSLLDASGALHAYCLWSRVGSSKLSPVRRHILDEIARNTTPVSGRPGISAGVTTRMAQWDRLIGRSHEEILAVVNGLGHTSCYLVNGGIAIKAGTALSRPNRSGFMTGQSLYLNRVNEHVPGAYIEAQPGRLPRPGDHYSSYSSNPAHADQKYGHVGIVLSVENGILRTFDGGQENRTAKLGPDGKPVLREGKPALEAKEGVALIKERRYEEVRINGWVDVDIYYYGNPWGEVAPTAASPAPAVAYPLPPLP